MPKQRRLKIIFGIILAVILFFTGYLRRQYVVPIVMYHLVNPEENPFIQRMIVSPETFQRQMHFLKEKHYNVVTLESLVSLIKEQKNISPRTIAITFDDGYKDNYTHAFPILKKYNFPATIFIIVNEVARADRLSWDEIRQMQSSGLISFGSHTLGPEPLTDIKSLEEVKKQIFDSKKILEEKLGTPITMFSYPAGRFNRQIRQLVIDAGYALAVTTSPGKEYPDNDVFALKRIRISENAGNLFIFWAETSGFYTFFKERRHK
ncbi:MAG: polysaccharide deacetylase family protein [Candidatus Omnitrophica bacterium]|nr:polysaccharide deacetylase family protein [Candidatus Omnitrophota bacterium]MBI5144585.1 polysaccharide deacetylase family protein [Candidatus Omnitrophota bacterium]